MRKDKTRNKLIATLFVIACVLAALSGAACGNKEKTETLEIEVVSDAFREELVITKEYDAETLVEKKDGVTYSIKSLFYMNADFQRVDIPFSGMKFTQNEPYDVTIVIHGESETEYGDATVELKISYLTNARERALAESWNDEGVVKTYTANPAYLTGEAVTAVKVRYNGHYNPIAEGPNFGTFIAGSQEFSYTNSDNAVVVFDVYNANDYELTFGLLHTVDKQKYDMVMNVSAPAGQWTKVCWSLHALGLDADTVIEKGSFSVKVRVADETVSAPYDYTFYVCNPDVTDYSAEKFPNLEYRSPEEIAQERYDSLKGDELDRKLVGFAISTANYDVTTDTTVKKEGESSIKATFTRNKLHAFTTPDRGTIMNDQKGVLSSVYKPADIDWSKAFFGVWVKHTPESKAANVSLQLRFANTTDGKTWHGSEYFVYDAYPNNRNLAATDEWQYLEWNLSDFDIATKNVTDYKFCLCTEIGSSVGDVKTVWIDGITVFSRDEKGFLTDMHTANYSAEIDTATVPENIDYSAKYTFTKGETGYPTQVRGTFLNDTAGALFGYDTVNKVTDWSKKVYIGFWLKNTTGYTVDLAVRFANTQNGADYKGWKSAWQMDDYNMRFWCNGSITDWTYMEMCLSDEVKSNDGTVVVHDPIYTEKVTGWKLLLATEMSDSGSFYIAGLSVYNKAE